MTPAQLKAARLQLDLSQDALGEALGGLPGRTVRKWENGERPLPPLLEQRAAVTVLRLHDALRTVKK